uniref:Uncharacterized protein n=1 Tax=Aegilops tauschii subsp. strangulata TaxID=200361 RepID=A0A453MYA7_AEGTS
MLYQSSLVFSSKIAPLSSSKYFLDAFPYLVGFPLEYHWLFDLLCL